MIGDKKKEALKKRLEELNILEKDLNETFIIGSGKGGQKLQKTASCVVLKHEPSGISVRCQKSRSREDNRFFARRLLCDQLEEKLLGKQSSSQIKAEKIRKQKKRRKRRHKEP